VSQVALVFSCEGVNSSGERSGNAEVIFNSNGEPIREDDIDRGVPTDETASEGIGDPIFSNGDGE